MSGTPVEHPTTHVESPALLDAAGSAAWEWHVGTGEVHLAPTWRALLGGADTLPETAEAALALVHHEDRPSLQQRLADARLTATGEGECMVRVQRRDGGFEWLHLRAAVTDRGEDGTPTRVAGVGTSHDQRLQLLAAATRDALWDWDVLSGVCWWSPRAVALFGLDPEHDATLAARTSRLHPDDHARVAALLQQAMDGDAEVWDAEYRVRLADGRYGEFHDHGHIVRLPSGAVRRIVGAMTDVTAANDAHRSLVAAHERLRASSRDVHLTETRERAALARELHDEFGQLLTAAKISASWFKTFPVDELPVLRQQAFTDKVTSLLDVLDMALHGVRNVATQLRPPALDQLGLARALEGLAAQIERYAGLHCLVDIDQATRARAFGPVEGAAIYRIVQELLTNTARHAQATTVRVQLATTDGMVRIEVRDDGRGIPPETARVSGSLGLKGVRERAELLGGQVRIEGTPGAGTSVRVTVPVGDGA